uniref:AMP-binding protein n=1 Tax=Ningiella ruwaisensis TaxID=2364274 RepID=UPI00109F460F|nr:AMP-binding protein [Ningiella ruwaisensis]
MKNVNNIADLLEDAMLKYGRKPAFHCLGQTLTFAQIDEHSRNLAAWLQHESGLKQGDRVAIQLPNLIQYPIAAYAVLRAGMVIVNTNPLYTTREMKHQFNDSGAKALIVLKDLKAKFDEIKRETEIQTLITTHATDMLDIENKSKSQTGVQEQHSESLLQVDFKQALEQGKSNSLQMRESQSKDDVCVLQYTGGTTGVSKGAMLTHGNLISNAKQTMERLTTGFDFEDEILVCPLPLYHIYAFTVNLVMFASEGHLSVLIPNPRDISAFIDAIKPFQFTGFAGLNTLFVGLCSQEAFRRLDFSKLKLTISGGTTLTSAAASQWMEVTGCSIAEGYGLSETSPVLSINEPGNEVLGSVGKPLVDTDIRFIDSSGQDVTEGEEGELIAKGPQVMKGYWKREAESDKVFTPDGYFRTGDIGYRMKSGHIKIVDRLKDMICVSGFNVYPNEVEDVLTQHPQVLEAAVVGKPCNHSGEKVCAYVTLSGELSKEELISHCKQSLTGYKVPKDIFVLDELPKSTVGKILRRELR